MEEKGEQSATDRFPCVHFQGELYILVGGALTTSDDFINGRASYAHIFGNRIVRRGTQIGTTDEFIHEGEMEVFIPNVYQTLAKILTTPWD